jgi:hypothetical protein
MVDLEKLIVAQLTKKFSAFHGTQSLITMSRSRVRGAIPPLPQYVFMAWCSVKEKHRNNFTFVFKG